MEGEGSLCHTSCPWGLSGLVGLAGGERKHRGGSGTCGCVEGGQLRVPRLHHRTVFPFTSEQSWLSGCFTCLFFLGDLLRPVVAQLTPTEGHFNIRK